MDEPDRLRPRARDPAAAAARLEVRPWTRAGGGPDDEAPACDRVGGNCDPSHNPDAGPTERRVHRSLESARRGRGDVLRTSDARAHARRSRADRRGAACAPAALGARAVRLRDRPGARGERAARGRDLDRPRADGRDVTRVEGMDLEAGTLALDPGQTKNGEGRVVVLTADLKLLLTEQVERVKGLERPTKRIIPALFPDLSGRFTGQPRRDFRRAWATACDKAGHAAARSEADGSTEHGASLGAVLGGDE